MIKSKIMITVIVACYICILNLTLVESYAYNKLAMPEGLENVYLGMSLKELKKTKPDLVSDDFSYINLFFEKKLGNEFFSFASYKFIDDSLAEITLSKEGTPDYIKSRTPALIKACSNIWGKNYLKKIGIGRNVKTKETNYYPIIYWEKPGAKIILTITNKLYTIRIIDSKIKLKMKFKEPVNQDEVNKLFKQLQIDNGV